METAITLLVLIVTLLVSVALAFMMEEVLLKGRLYGMYARFCRYWKQRDGTSK